MATDQYGTRRHRSALNISSVFNPLHVPETTSKHDKSASRGCCILFWCSVPEAMSRGHIGAGTQRPSFVPGSDTSMRHLLHNGCTWVYTPCLSDLASAKRERRCTQIRLLRCRNPQACRWISHATARRHKYLMVCILLSMLQTWLVVLLLLCANVVISHRPVTTRMP